MKLDWNPQVYKRYVPLVGSATAQQIARKNNEGWRGFLVLKRIQKNGKLPPTIKQVKLPGYWKREGRYVLRILFRRDSYHLREGRVDLPRHLSIPFKGELKWVIARNLTLKTRDDHFQGLEELGLRRTET